MTENNDTITKTEEEETSEAQSQAADFFIELGSAVLATAGQVLASKYSTERLDGKPRTTGA